jgi:hypothetical protein
VMVAPGTYAVEFSGLAASTDYYAHYVAVDLDAIESNVASSAVFTTDAALTVSSSTSTATGGKTAKKGK